MTIPSVLPTYICAMTVNVTRVVKTLIACVRVVVLAFVGRISNVNAAPHAMIVTVETRILCALRLMGLRCVFSAKRTLTAIASMKPAFVPLCTHVSFPIIRHAQNRRLFLKKTADVC